MKNLKILLLLISSALSTYVALADSPRVLLNGIYYILDNKTKTASVASQKDTHPFNSPNIYKGYIKIPSKVQYHGTEYEVDKIAPGTFRCGKENKNLKGVELPKTIKSIGATAFYNCSALESIKLGDSVNFIGESCFEECHSLCSIRIPKDVKYLEDHVFCNCTRLTSVEMGNDVKSIGEFAFAFCRSLKSINIPSSVVSIKRAAFCQCYSLTNLYVPENITIIGEGAFQDVPNVECHGIASTEKFDSKTINGVVDGFLVFRDHTKTEVSACSNAANNVVVVPEGVKVIAENAFRCCDKISSIVLPNSLETIEGWAFQYCTSLTSIVLPQNVKIVRFAAFASCESLQKITILSLQTVFEERAFSFDPIKRIYYQKGFDVSQLDKCGIKSDICLKIKLDSPESAKINETSKDRQNFCTILSPKDKYTYYSNSTISIRYKVENLSEGQTIEYFVDDPTKSVPIQGSKGVRVEQGTELKIDIPQSGTHVVGIRVVDAYGTRSEDTRTFTYRSVHKPTLHVFAVGVNKYKYKGDGFKDLKYAVDDAKDFTKTIVNLADMDTYKQVDTTLLLDGAANRTNLEEQLIELLGRVRADDVVMLFFSGHGVNINGDSYFLTSDAKDPLRGLSFHFINQRIKDMKSKGGHILIFMDACHSGGMGNAKGSSSKSITLAEPGAIGYYSCTENQTSIEKEELKNGVFTYALIEGMRGNENGQITMWGLYNSILEIVKKENKDQYPRLKHDNEIDNDYVIFYKKK